MLQRTISNVAAIFNGFPRLRRGSRGSCNAARPTSARPALWWARVQARGACTTSTRCTHPVTAKKSTMDLCDIFQRDAPKVASARLACQARTQQDPHFVIEPKQQTNVH